MTLGAVLGTAEFFPTGGWGIVALLMGLLAVAAVAAELSRRRAARDRSDRGRDADAASGEDGHVAT